MDGEESGQLDLAVGVTLSRGDKLSQVYSQGRWRMETGGPRLEE